MNEDEVGIELLKDLATDVVGLMKKVADAKADDDKISKTEVIGMLPKAVAVGKDLLKFKSLIVEAKDFTTLEGKELLNHIMTLDIVPEKAQIVAINVLEIIEKEVDIWNDNVVPIIDVFKK